MKDDISFSNQILKEGGLVLYPTDTVWGLCCDATNDDAVSKVFRLKKEKKVKV